MDKQVQYVEIKKCSGEYLWYKRLIRCRIPVKGEENRHQWIADLPAKDGSGVRYLIDKSDCEVVPHPSHKSEVGEGHHLIKTEQLQELYRALAEDYITKESLQVVLRSWFPSVFTPKKQVIEVTDRKGVKEFYRYEIMGLMHTSENKADAYVITHYEHGQELLLHLSEVFNECSYKLVPAE